MGLLYVLFTLLLGSNLLFRTAEGLIAEKIVGGIPARKMEFKYVVAVMYKTLGLVDQNPCAGSILGNFFIATVAHCFYNRPSGQLRHAHYYIAFGVKNINEPLPTSRSIRVDRVIIHSTYEPHGTDSYSNGGNLAIVKVKQNLRLRPNHPNFSKLTVRNFNLTNHHGKFKVAAYGYHENEVVFEKVYGRAQYRQIGNTDGKLRYAKGDIITREECMVKVSNDIAPGNMCVQLARVEPDKKIGICKGDSGAPLVHGIYLDGIAINNFIECDEEHAPGIYIDILHYVNFIRDALEDKITDEMYIIELVESRIGQFEFQTKYA